MGFLEYFILLYTILIIKLSMMSRLWQLERAKIPIKLYTHAYTCFSSLGDLEI